jgi:proteasome lid subunit RPN8/RPN11
MKLQRKVLERIYEHALREYPDECCGIVTGTSKKQLIHLFENIQNRMHAEDPARFPRDARTAYFIDRGVFDKVIASADSQGEDVIALYHSHTEHEAYFSEDDVAAQTVFGEPEFPDAVHVVVSVMSNRIHDLKCFKWDRELKRFIVLDNCC